MNSNQPSTKPSPEATQRAQQAQPAPARQLRPVNKGVLLAIAVISFIAFADAAYITADHYLQVPVPCSVTHGCENVLTSRYATVAGLPIALIGAIAYLIILGFSLFLFTSEKPAEQKIAPAWLLFGITGIGFISALYLLYLQFNVIHSICQYCLVADTSSIILFILSCVLLSSFLRSRSRARLS